MPAPFRLAFNLPFHDAIEQARQRSVVLPAVYYDEAQRDMRRASFTISDLAGLDQIRDVLDSLNEAMRRGDSFATWRKWADGQGWGLPAGRIETIFRTNVQTAYAQGNWRQFLETRGTRPFLMYSAVNDNRTRPAHAAMDGHIAHISDPIWKRWTPPAGYNCRCTLIALSEKQALARGLGKGAVPAVNPDPGFGGGDPENLVLSNLDRATRERLARLDPIIAQKVATRIAPPLSRPTPPVIRPLPWDPRQPAGAFQAVSFDRAPSWVVDGLRHVPPEPAGGVATGSSSASYHRNSVRIAMRGDVASLRASLLDQGTWRHEYGHYADHMLGAAYDKANKSFNVHGYRSSIPDFSKAVQGDALVLKKTANTTRAAADAEVQRLSSDKDPTGAVNARLARLGINRQQAVDALTRHDAKVMLGMQQNEALLRIAVALENRDAQALMDLLLGNGHDGGVRGVVPSLSDLVGSMTRNAVAGPKNGWGHSNAYYRADSARPYTETFANLLALHGEGSSFWSRIVDILAPKTSSVFRGILANGN